MFFIIIISFGLSISLIGVNGITPNNPCDPLRSNVSVLDVIKSSTLEMMMQFNIAPPWLRQSMTYVNCSRRGLERIPSTIPSDVQILDLSSNVLSQARKQDLAKFTNLQVLWLYSNCIGDLQDRHFYCSAASAGAYETDVFSTLRTLKLLDIGGNAFKTLPINLPTNLEYLDVSRTGIMKIEQSELAYMKNLLMLDATNLCFLGRCKNQLHIDNNTFENSPIKILQLSENRGIFHLLNYLTSYSLLCISFSQTFGSILGPEHLRTIASVKRLDMHLLNPNTKIRLKVLNNTFDKLSALEHLDLSSNMIDTLPQNIFVHNHKLTYLDLSGNCLHLTVFDPTYVPEQIKYLYLGFNGCQHKKTKNNVGHEIQSSNDCEADRTFGPSFAKMKNLTLLSYAKPGNLGTAKAIPFLLSFHELNKNTMFNLLQLRRLSKLIIRNNFIRVVDLGDVRCISNLSYLDLYNNIIENITVSQQSCKLQLKTADANCSSEIKLLFSYNKLGVTLSEYDLVYPTASWIDLQFNLISSVHEEAFKNMKCLQYIDLRNNPLTFIHLKSFRSLQYLKTIHISSTSIIRSRNSFAFLKTLSTSPFLHLSLLNDNLFDRLRGIHFRAKSVFEVDLSDNRIPSADHFENGLKAFPNAKKLLLMRCGIKFSDVVFPFHLMTSLTFVDLSQNQLQEVTSKMLQSAPLLSTLILSQNQITQLDIDLLELLPDLENLDLSHNHIALITSNRTTNKRLKNLRRLNLQNNYIFELSEDIFSLTFLLKLECLDLRWNSIECYCEMTETFGQWLSKNPYKFIDRPGFLPQCSSSVQRFGGCVTCAAATGECRAVVMHSLLEFSTTNLCSTSFNLFLFVSFTSVFICFILTSLFFSSSKGMLWLAKISTRKVRRGVDEDEAMFSDNFAFHGFVLFDTEDNRAAEWVDDQLVSQLNNASSGMKITLLGRDDQCGFSYATQILRKIEASRKVIIVLTDDFWQSCIRNFVLSAIEDLYCQTGYDRSILITFESDGHVGGLLRRQRRKSPLSILQFPDDQRYLSIFWESLRNLLL